MTEIGNGEPAGGESKGDPGTAATSDVVAEPLLESLREDLEAFGLNGYEARVLLALLQCGSATASQAAELAGVGRTSVYPVLEALSAKGLAEQVPGRSGVWTSAGRETVLGRLYSAEEQRLRDLAARKERAQKLLEELGGEGTATAVPYVHLVRGANQVAKVYDRLLDDAEGELLMFTRPPYSHVPGRPNATVLRMLGRGVSTRVLYEAVPLDAPGAECLRQEVEVYHEAGVDGRVADELPMKLVVADRKAVLLAMTDPFQPTVGFPTSLLIEHPGFAAFAAAAFQQFWAAAQPYDHRPGGDEESPARRQTVSRP